MKAQLNWQFFTIDFYHTGTVNFGDLVCFVSVHVRFYTAGTLDPTCDLNHDGNMRRLVIANDALAIALMFVLS